MRILVLPLPAAAHIGAMVSACWALRVAGHDILFACSSQLAGVVRSAGFNVVEITVPDQTMERFRLGMPREAFPEQAYGNRDDPAGARIWRRTAWAWFEHARRHLDAYLSFAQSWQPDVVLTDPLAVGGRLAGGVLGLPTVLNRWGVDPTGGPFEEEARRLTGEFAGRDVLEPALTIDACPPVLQVPGARPGYQVRFMPYNGVGTMPDWAMTRPARRRVGVCLGGTVLSLAGPRALHAAVAALTEVPDVEVVVAVSASDRRIVGELPDGVRTVEALPLHLFLDTCDLLVHHGGSTTGLTATSFGLPQLVLPQFFDQFDYGRLLAAAGAGLCVPGAQGQADVERLRHMVTALLDDDGHAAAARSLAASMAAAPVFDPAVIARLAEPARGERSA